MSRAMEKKFIIIIKHDGCPNVFDAMAPVAPAVSAPVAAHAWSARVRAAERLTVRCESRTELPCASQAAYTNGYPPAPTSSA